MYRYLLILEKKADLYEIPEPEATLKNYYYLDLNVAIREGIREIKEGEAEDFKIIDLQNNQYVFDSKH